VEGVENYEETGEGVSEKKLAQARGEAIARPSLSSSGGYF
jgi:hypothetical protein